MDKNLTTIDKVLLLGLLPLLGGTNSLKQALIIAVSAVLISIIIKGIASVISVNEDHKWYLLIGTGIALSYLFYTAVLQFMPDLEIYLNNYLLLLGVTPLIYLGASKDKANFLSYQGSFFLLMIIVGALREVLGQGAIFSIQLTAAGSPPLGFVKDFPGAFLLISIIYLLVELWKKNKESVKQEGSENLV